MGLTSTAAAVSIPTQPPLSRIIADLYAASVSLMAKKIRTKINKNNPSLKGIGASTAPQGEKDATIPPKNAFTGGRMRLASH